MLRATALIISAVWFAGCSINQPTAPIVTPHERRWPADMTPAEAAALSPDQAKVILVVRAVLEAEYGEPVHARYKVTAEADGWEVFVDFIPPMGYAKPTGSFSVVHLDRQYRLRSVTSGA